MTVGSLDKSGEMKPSRSPEHPAASIFSDMAYPPFDAAYACCALAVARITAIDAQGRNFKSRSA